MYPISKFSNWLSANNYSNNTIKNYVHSANKFIKFIGENTEITEDNIIEYVLELRKTLKPKSISCHLDSLQKFLDIFKLNIEIPKRPKTIDKVPKYFSYKFFKNNIVPMVEVVSEKPLRDKVLLYFLFFTGIRKGELIRLKREDFDLDKRTVKIYMPKVKKERFAFYTNRVKNLLKDYFSLESETKNAFNIGINTISTLLKKLDPYFKEVHLHPHLFRSSFAVHLLKNGIDISVVSTLMGHSNIQSTMKYLKLKIEDIKNIYNKFIK